jgi:hypothetical protein
MATISIPTGSVTLFRQVTAPVKWTKNITLYNDYALRVTSGTAGESGPASTVPFSTLNSTTVTIGGSYRITGASVTAAPGGSGIQPHTHRMGPASPLGPSYPSPAPGHTYRNDDSSYNYAGAGNPATPGGRTGYDYYVGYSGVATGAAGTGAAHPHTATANYSPFPFGPFDITSTFSFSVKYLDVILCTRTG